LTERDKSTIMGDFGYMPFNFEDLLHHLHSKTKHNTIMKPLAQFVRDIVSYGIG